MGLRKYQKDSSTIVLIENQFWSLYKYIRLSYFTRFFNLHSNAWHDFAKSKVTSKCKNYEPSKNLIEKVPVAPPPF